MNYPIDIKPKTLRVLELEALKEETTVHDLITNMINDRIQQRAFDLSVMARIHSDVLDLPKVRKELNSRLRRGGFDAIP